MKNFLQKLASDIYIYIYRARSKHLVSRISKHSKASTYTKLSSYIKSFRTQRFFGILASTALISLMTLAVFPISIKTSAVEATIGSPVASTTTLTMTTGHTSANLSVLIDGVDGTFASSSSSDLAEFNVTTNNYTGYTLTIAGSDDNGLLTHTDTNITTNNTLSSIDSATNTATFSDDTMSATYNNKWGYLPSKYNSMTNTDTFYPSPTTTASTLDVTNAANTTANEYTIGLGARVDYTKPSGTYTNTFILAAVGNPVAYSITYADNTGDSTISNMPSVQAGTSAVTAVELEPDSTPERTGYTFRAWCSEETTVNGTVCSGTEYASGDTLNFIDQTIVTSTATLYAVWDANTYSLTITFAGSSITSVQVRTASGTGGTLMGTVSTSGGSVPNLAYGTAYYLYPSFPSGSLFSSWANTGSYGTLPSTSSSNPTFTIGAGDGAVTLTAKACTVISGYMQDFNKSAEYCSTSGSLTDRRDNQVYTVAKINGNWWMTRNLAIGCNGSGSTYGSSVSSKSLTSSTSNVSFTWSTPEALLSAASSNTKTADYSTGRMQCNATYGAWYNYFAATAGTISGESNFTNATKDICPSGWRLPTESEQSGITSAVSAFNPVAGGLYANGRYDGINGRTTGYWWSATANGDTHRYFLGYNGSSLNTFFYDRVYGIYVRCIKS